MFKYRYASSFCWLGFRFRTFLPGIVNSLPTNLTPLFDIYRNISAVFEFWQTNFWHFVALPQGFSKVSKYMDQSSSVSINLGFSVFCTHIAVSLEDARFFHDAPDFWCSTLKLPYSTPITPSVRGVSSGADSVLRNSCTLRPGIRSIHFFCLAEKL